MSVFQRSRLFHSCLLVSTGFRATEVKSLANCVCFSVCFNRSLNLRARDYVSGSIYGNCTRNDKSNILSNNEKMYSLELDSVSPSGCSCLYKMDTRESERGSTICRSVWSHDQEEHLLYSTLEECGKVLILYLLPLILLGTTSVIIGLSLRKTVRHKRGLARKIKGYLNC